MALSKEQKEAKKEAKRQEKLRIETELRKKLKLDELKREMKIQAIKKAEIDKNFRELVQTIKEPDFKMDVAVMWKSFERIFDKKDYLIQHTVNLINMANDQHQRLFTSFADKIDVQIKQFLAELEDLSKENETRMTTIMQSSKLDDENVRKSQLSTERQLNLFIYYAGSTHDTSAWQTRGENLVRADEESTMYLNKREDLRSELEEKYNSQWELYKITLRNYIVGTADLQKKVKKLLLKDHAMSELIAKQAKRINGNEAFVRHLRSELRAYETGSKQSVFRSKQRRYRSAYHKLKMNMKRALAVDTKNLICLVSASTETIKLLEGDFSKSEKILRFVTECRKYESQREKVLPYASKMFETPTEKSHKPSLELLESTLATAEGLTRFWHKISRADLIKRALIREKEQLLKENALLEQRLQENFEESGSSNLHACICVQSTPSEMERGGRNRNKDTYYTTRTTRTRLLM